MDIEHQGLQFESKQNWKGLQPQKWNGGRLHIKPLDTLNNLQNKQFVFKPPKKPIQPKQSNFHEYKPHNRQFHGYHGKTTIELDHKYGVKPIQFKPTQKQERPQQRHLSMQKQNHLEDINYGIRTFQNSNQTLGKTWNIENQMNQKQRIHHLEDRRNNYGCASLGDKSYKYPENSSEFYKSGGLIAGSSIRARPIKNASEKKLISTKVPGKLTWKQRVQIEERKDEQDAIDELDGWVENTLKDANPNYQDPDLFFENMEQKQEEGIQKGIKGKKDQKKGKK